MEKSARSGWLRTQNPANVPDAPHTRCGGAVPVIADAGRFVTMEDNPLGPRSVNAMAPGMRAAEPALVPVYTVEFTDGLWRSLVARLTGGQEVAGSSPASPTTNRSKDPANYSPLNPPLTWMLWVQASYNP